MRIPHAGVTRSHRNDGGGRERRPIWRRGDLAGIGRTCTARTRYRAQRCPRSTAAGCAEFRTLARMRTLFADAMRGGAMGLSSPLLRPCSSGRRRISRLPLSPRRVLYDTHMSLSLDTIGCSAHSRFDPHRPRVAHHCEYSHIKGAAGVGRATPSRAIPEARGRGLASPPIVSLLLGHRPWRELRQRWQAVVEIH